MWESDYRENKMERIFAPYSSQGEKGSHSCMLGIGLCYCCAQRQEVLDSQLYAWKGCSIPPDIPLGECFDPTVVCLGVGCSSPTAAYPGVVF